MITGDFPGYCCDHETQCALLHRILKSNAKLYALLEHAKAFPLPYYIGAGCIVQTVWNHQLGLAPMYGIDDVDFVYYDADTSYEAEDRIITGLRSRLAPSGLKMDIKNQARVHLWYPSRFGQAIEPYHSLEEAIATWPTTATSVGVRLTDSGLEVNAPFGLNDLFGRILRPNRVQITRAVYEAKISKWTSKWQGLRVVPWS